MQANVQLEEIILFRMAGERVVSAQIVGCNQLKKLPRTIIETVCGEAQTDDIGGKFFDSAHFGVNALTDVLGSDDDKIVGRNAYAGKEISGRLLTGRQSFLTGGRKLSFNRTTGTPVWRMSCTALKTDVYGWLDSKAETASFSHARLRIGCIWR